MEHVSAARAGVTRRWIVRGILALLLAALGFVTWVYAASEAHLGSFEPPPAFTQPIPSDAAALARGEYIAMTTCNECHGFGLRGDTPWEEDTAPDLVIISAYDEAAFRRLMREGVAIGDRELEMMSPVARSRFAWFTEQEVTDVYAFLTDMSRRAAEAQ